MKIKRIELDLPLYVDPNEELPRWKPVVRRHYLIPGRDFAPGTKAALKENMTPEAHERRIRGLIKAWGYKFKQKNGINTMAKVARRKRSHDLKRGWKNKVRLTVAKEAREIQDMARQSAAQAMEIAREIMANPLERASDRLQALNFITERAFGRATQTNINAQVDSNGNPKEVSAEELNKRIETTLRRAEELTGRASKPEASSQRPVNVRKRNRHTSRSTVH